MECMTAQARPRFILSSERILWEWSQNLCLLQGGKSPLPAKFSSEEARTQDATSSSTTSLTHYHRAIPAPQCLWSTLSLQEDRYVTVVVVHVHGSLQHYLFCLSACSLHCTLFTAAVSVCHSTCGPWFTTAVSVLFQCLYSTRFTAAVSVLFQCLYSTRFTAAVSVFVSVSV